MNSKIRIVYTPKQVTSEQLEIQERRGLPDRWLILKKSKLLLVSLIATNIFTYLLKFLYKKPLILA